MTRIALTCDFLRYDVNGSNWSNFQLRNLEWLHELMAGLFGTGIDVARVIPPADSHGLKSAMGNSSAVAEYTASSQEAWATRYDAATLDVFPGVLDTLCAYDLVIGFELPPSIRRHLHRHRVRYVNVLVHPLRFLRDLCFSVTTNAPDIAERITLHAVPQKEVDEQVRRFRALCRRRLLPALAIPSGIPVLIGQTEFDSVLIKEGRFAVWSDYGEALESELRDFDEVVFLEHPLRPSQEAIVAYLRGELGKTVVSTNANGYGVLFSAQDVPRVMTLSSSLGVEAEAMGYSTRFLVDDPRRKFLVREFEAEVPVAVGHALLDAGFWRQLASDDRGASAPATGRNSDPFFMGENYVRKSLEAWSYGALQNGLEGISSRKTLVPAATLSESRQADLLGQLVQAATPLSPQHALQRMQTLGLFLELSAPPMNFGEISDASLSVNSPASPLLTGFYSAEPWGRWSSDRLSQIVCSIDPATVGRCKLVMEVEVAAFDDLVGQAPILAISYEESIIGLMFFRASQPKVTARLEVRPTSAYCVFDLHFTDLQRPSVSRSSVDDRALGFALSRLTFALQPAEASPAETEPPSIWGIGPDRLTPLSRVAAVA